MIIAVALRYRNNIWALPAPKRHYHIAKMLGEELKLHVALKGEQGFIDSNEGFVDRKRAASIAIDAGQTERLKYSFDDLFSEDIWPPKNGLNDEQKLKNKYVGVLNLLLTLSSEVSVESGDAVHRALCDAREHGFDYSPDLNLNKLTNKAVDYTD